MNLPPLQCRSCAREFDVAELVWRCPCGGVLDVIETWRPDGDSVLPVPVGASTTLGEGNTPMIPSKTSPGIRFKLEFLNPTLSFKDRGAVVLAALAERLGVGEVVVDSSGNAGTAAAAYFARAGINCQVLVPAATSPEKLAQIRAHGAALTLVPGDRAATAAAAARIAQRPGIFYASHVYHPYFMHGVKTYGYEIWQQNGRRLPAAVLVPVGNGTLLLGCHLAFTELVGAGLADRMPALIAVQAAGCAPLAAAWDGRDPDLGSTLAEGIAITAPPRAEQILAAVRDSGGAIVTVDDDAIVAGRQALGREGLFVEPTAAVCYAAAAGAAARSGPDWQRITDLLAGGDVVIPLCGAGLKHPGD
ncbi:pyridoxal-5'-phosphate-dependent protein subunit beta [Mycolicibacterium aromaticivorans JS19b1 = JCM 16368]|uniref:Pyridoxal-5'-phosphate-dependent protein subunit beta n=1 Tax=Mycolicibacterium aromaticivorans JS19b1 = JCM 16368 TaxID=1440774 RepID=A0A064CPE4_9MYCO|nr:pyridoxal-phosphate dependent enzyme [Mycolicibacterium aromaticivorans]KDF02216.1 pyridoxal-5'-phosphate-dependent protein subunit beta [Mycolicibacterium aromaticivorans JS19b1 = JCM 16368]